LAAGHADGPIPRIGLRNLSRSHLENRLDRLDLLDVKFQAVQIEKEEKGKKSRPHIVVGERVVANQAQAIRSGEARPVDPGFIDEQMLWACLRGMKPVLIARSDEAAVLRQALRVQNEERGWIQCGVRAWPRRETGRGGTRMPAPRLHLYYHQ